MEWSFGAVVSFRQTKYLSLYSGDIIKYNIIFYRILTPSSFPFTLSNIIIKLVKCMKSSNQSLENWILLIWCYFILGTTGEKNTPLPPLPLPRSGSVSVVRLLAAAEGHRVRRGGEGCIDRYPQAVFTPGWRRGQGQRRRRKRRRGREERRPAHAPIDR